MGFSVVPAYDAEMQETPSITPLEVLAQEQEKLKVTNLAHNTRMQYGYAWRDFERWCALMSRAALPADAATVELYVTDELACHHKKVSTVAHRAAAIADKHRAAGFPSPVSRIARLLMTGARRQRGEQPRQMRPLEVTQLRAITQALMEDGAPLSTRNRAMLVMGFASGLRGASLVQLTMEDISFVTQGVLVRIRKEKQDQEAKGRYLGLPHGKNLETCPVRSLLDWIKARGNAPGALFCKIGSKTFKPLDAGDVLVLVKKCLQRIGVDPRDYGAHSLRAGMITAAGEAGATDLLIGKQSGHRSMEVLRRYFRSQDAFRGNAVQLIGL